MRNYLFKPKILSTSFAKVEKDDVRKDTNYFRLKNNPHAKTRPFTKINSLHLLMNTLLILQITYFFFVSDDYIVTYRLGRS